MTKTAKAAKAPTTSRTIKMIDPAELILIHDKSHPLYDPRVEWEVDRPFLINAILNGFTHGEVEGVETKAGIEVIIGQRRTLHFRRRNEILADPTNPASVEILKECYPEGIPEQLPQPCKIPVAIRKGESTGESYKAKLVENLFRKEDDPYTAAKKMAHYKELRLAEGASKKGINQEIAGIWGCSADTVVRNLQILKAPSPIRKALGEGRVTAKDVIDVMRKHEDPLEQIQALKLTAEDREANTSEGKKRPRKKAKTITPKTAAKVLEILGDDCTKNVPVNLALKWFTSQDKKGEFLKLLQVEL